MRGYPKPVSIYLMTNEEFSNLQAGDRVRAFVRPELEFRVIKRLRSGTVAIQSVDGRSSTKRAQTPSAWERVA